MLHLNRSSNIINYDALRELIQHKTKNLTLVSQKILSELVTRVRNCSEKMCSPAHEYLKQQKSEIAQTVHVTLLPYFSQEGVSLQGLELRYANRKRSALPLTDASLGRYRTSEWQ